MESTSVSHSSILTGASSVYENISMMPPLIENWPFPSTIAVLTKPMDTIFFASSSVSILLVLSIVIIESIYLFRGISLSDTPSMVVTTVSRLPESALMFPASPLRLSASCLLLSLSDTSTCSADFICSMILLIQLNLCPVI